jgi:predicted MFS family arabinose efflux permease
VALLADRVYGPFFFGNLVSNGAGAVAAAFFVERIRERIGRERAASAGLGTLAAAIAAFPLIQVHAYAVATLAIAGALFQGRDAERPATGRPTDLAGAEY